MEQNDIVARMGALARRIELEFAEMASGWGEMSTDERRMLLGVLASDAPDVAHMLCPSYGRFVLT